MPVAEGAQRDSVAASSRSFASPQAAKLTPSAAAPLPHRTRGRRRWASAGGPRKWGSARAVWPGGGPGESQQTTRAALAIRRRGGCTHPPAGPMRTSAPTKRKGRAAARATLCHFIFLRSPKRMSLTKIKSVDAHSPAQRAGVRPGETLTHINGRPIAGCAGL